MKIQLSEDVKDGICSFSHHYKDELSPQKRWKLELILRKIGDGLSNKDIYDLYIIMCSFQISLEDHPYGRELKNLLGSLSDIYYEATKS